MPIFARLIALGLVLALAPAPFADARVADAPAMADFRDPGLAPVRAAMRAAGWREFGAADGLTFRFLDAQWVLFEKGPASAPRTALFTFDRKAGAFVLRDIQLEPNFAATGGLEEARNELYGRRLHAFARREAGPGADWAARSRNGFVTTTLDPARSRQAVVLRYKGRAHPIAGFPFEPILDPKETRPVISADGRTVVLLFREVGAAHVVHRALVARRDAKGVLRHVAAYDGSEPAAAAALPRNEAIAIDRAVGDLVLGEPVPAAFQAALGAPEAEAAATDAPASGLRAWGVAGREAGIRVLLGDGARRDAIAGVVLTAAEAARLPAFRFEEGFGLGASLETVVKAFPQAVVRKAADGTQEVMLGARTRLTLDAKGRVARIAIGREQDAR